MCREGSDESESRESVNKQFPEGRGDTAKGIRRPLTYVNDTAPEFELYQYAGEHYEGWFPTRMTLPSGRRRCKTS